MLFDLILILYFNIVFLTDDFDDLSVGSVPTELCGLQSPMTDGTIEEDFEAAFARETSASGNHDSSTSGAASGAPAGAAAAMEDEDFGEVSRHGIVEVVGDDAAGRKVVVVSACRLPSNKGFDHQKFLR